MMDVGRPIEEKRYKSIYHCIRLIFDKEGYKGFYKGAFTNAMRGSGSALVLVLYD